MSRKHQSLIELMHDLIVDSEKGAKWVAEAVGKEHLTLLNECNTSQERHKLGLYLLIPIMNALNTDEPLHYLARERGGVFLRLPKASGMGEAYRAAVTATAEFGASMDAFGSSISPEGDGGARITDQELAIFEKKAQAALTSLAVFRETVRARAREQGGK